MKKILEIRGMSAIVVDRCDICLLSERNEGCLLCRHPDGPYRASFSKCPLPNAPEETDEWPEDENHRLGPNGERLIAETEYRSCHGCFYCGKECEGVECYEKIWKLSGDHK